MSDYWVLGVTIVHVHSGSRTIRFPLPCLLGEYVVWMSPTQSLLAPRPKVIYRPGLCSTQLVPNSLYIHQAWQTVAQ